MTWYSADKPLQNTADKPLQYTADKPLQLRVDKLLQCTSNNPLQYMPDKLLQHYCKTRYIKLYDPASKSGLPETAVKHRSSISDFGLCD